MYHYEGMPTEEIVTPTVEQVFVIVEYHPTIAESHLDVELHRDAKHQSYSPKPRIREHIVIQR